MHLRLAATAAFALASCLPGMAWARVAAAAPLTLDEAFARVARIHPELRLFGPQTDALLAERDQAGLRPPMHAGLRLGLPSVSYYGARNLPFLEDPQLVAKPRAPVMFHFGQDDPLIPDAAVQAHRQALPGMEVFTYPAGHAFNREVGAHYHAPSAALARERTLAFLSENLR